MNNKCSLLNNNFNLSEENIKNTFSNYYKPTLESILINYILISSISLLTLIFKSPILNIVVLPFAIKNTIDLYSLLKLKKNIDTLHVECVEGYLKKGCFNDEEVVSILKSKSLDVKSGHILDLNIFDDNLLEKTLDKRIRLYSLLSSTEVENYIEIL